MKIYLVGGAVRDALLGIPVKERDWVVVGATPEQLLDAGYTRVGKDFPVFLHPQTHEEYALARVERKTAPGYHGFSMQFSPQVTLEEDLRRRDLTINAMAQSDQGEIIDPYGGREDISRRLLRHVSEAFNEDPVRILRVARFAARFKPMDFQVSPDTLQRMSAMVLSGEAAALVAERVWTETHKALQESRSDVYFEILAACGALVVVYPEIDELYRVSLAWAGACEALHCSAELKLDAKTRFAVLLCELGSIRATEQLCARGKVPNDCRDLALVMLRLRAAAAQIPELTAEDLLLVLESCDAWRRADRFSEALKGLSACQIEQSRLEGLRQAQQLTGQVALTAEQRAGLNGPAIGAAVRARRLSALQALLVAHATH